MPTLDPKEVNMTVGGLRLSGFAEGTFIEVAYNNDRYSLTKGADGEGVRVRSNDESARITVRLMTSAQGNTILNALSIADKVDNAGVAPCVIEHLRDGTLFEGDVWITKDPGRPFAKEHEPIEWVLECSDLVATHGSASDLP